MTIVEIEILLLLIAIIVLGLSVSAEARRLKGEIEYLRNLISEADGRRHILHTEFAAYKARHQSLHEDIRDSSRSNHKQLADEIISFAEKLGYERRESKSEWVKEDV